MTAMDGNAALNGAGGRGGISGGNPNIILFGEEDTMKSLQTTCLLIALIFFLPLAADAQQVKDYSSTINSFKSSPQLQWFFDNAYGYAVFPVVGKAALIVGGGYGQGQVYRQGRVTGRTDLFQASVGFQWGGQAFSEIIFFRDKWAYDAFTRGQYEFDANASAVVVTAGAQAKASSMGSSASASAGPRTGAQSQSYYASNGMAPFVYTKGGLMAELAIGGQKFTFSPL